MRIVIYDDETFEPITVVNVRGLTERHIAELNGRPLFLPIPAPTHSFTDFPSPRAGHPSAVTLWFERLARNGVITHMCFTRQADLAMIIGPSFLPGQQRRVNEMEDQIRGLNKLCDLLQTRLVPR